jgi:hypothetical protein
VRAGLSRGKAHELCGKPDHSSWQNKGDFWEKRNILGKWEFLVMNSEGSVGETRVRLFIGKEDALVPTIRSNGKWCFNF